MTSGGTALCGARAHTRGKVCVRQVTASSRINPAAPVETLIGKLNQQVLLHGRLGQARDNAVLSWIF